MLGAGTCGEEKISLTDERVQTRLWYIEPNPGSKVRRTEFTLPREKQDTGAKNDFET